MASSSSQTSLDHNPWISARRLFRSLQHSRLSVSFRRKRSSDKSALPGDRSGTVPSVWPPQSPFQSNDRISSVSSVSILPESCPPSTTDEYRHGIECPICTQFLPPGSFFSFQTCQHRSCLTCLKVYVQIEVTEGRIGISCPECPAKLHPGDIRAILNDDQLMQKYEEFMLRRALVLDPDTRWCPAPDCSYAVIASGCASCPQLTCERPGCGTLFCYHCKQRWHPNQTCDAARAERDDVHFPFSSDLNNDQAKQSMIKCCPRCGSMIMKLDDGSCNHMTCAGCGAEFCWLCLKEISDLHYLSPSGCTFWGKKPWTRKRKILWHLGMLIGAPIGISLIAGISFPVIIIGLPIFVGRKLLAKCRHMAKRKRHLVVASGVIASTLVSPVLAAIAVGAGVPMLLAYVYGVVPVSLCRDSCCSGHRSDHPSEFEFDIKDLQENQAGSSVLIADTAHVGDTSSKTLSSENPSVQNQSRSSKVEVVAEVSCDLARHAADEELKENADNSTGEDRNSNLTYTDAASYSVSANISDSRELANNNKGGVSVSDASLNGSSPGAYSFSAGAVAECAGASSSSSSESVHPRLLSSFHRHEKRSFPDSPSSHGASVVACHVKSFKRQSMSVGDSIDEKVEAERGCLSLHSLAEEENGLESFGGGSDIVAMVAVSEESPSSDSQGKLRPIQSLKSMAGMLVAEVNSAHRSGKSSDVADDVVSAEEKERLSCRPRVLFAEDLLS